MSRIRWTRSVISACARVQSGNDALPDPFKENQAMPLHDWTRVPAGLFHDFHQSWSVRIKDALNAGLLPKGLSALVEQRSGTRESDVLAIEQRAKRTADGGVAIAEQPATWMVRRTTNEIYAGRANRVVVKHHLGRIIAVIEIVSPGNKDSRAAVRDFVQKLIDFLRAGIHVLMVDLFPPTPRDPVGMHKVVWDEIAEEDFSLPPNKDWLMASYETGGTRTAYVEPVAIGDQLRDMPLFLANGLHVKVPLELTYRATWEALPEEVRLAVETGILPEADEE